MKNIKEIILPALLWLYAISQGISGGIEMPEMKIEPPDEIPIKFRIPIYLVCLFMGFIVVVMNAYRTKNKRTTVLKLFEKILGEESSKIIIKRINPPILGATFFGLIGIIGIIKAKIISAPEINQEIILFPFFISIGILIGWKFTRNINEKTAA